MTCSNKVDMLFWLLINSISFFAFQGSHHHHRSIEIKKRRRENWRQDLLYLKRHQKTKKKEFDQLNFFALSYEVWTNKQGHWIKMHHKSLKETTKFSLKRIPPFRITLGLLLIMANSGKIFCFSKPNFSSFNIQYQLIET